MARMVPTYKLVQYLPQAVYSSSETSKKIKPKFSQSIVPCKKMETESS